MSVILWAGRRKAITNKKKVVRKVGIVPEGQAATITAEWKVNAAGRKVVIAFSRDNMNVYVDESPIECTAFITDKGYDLDLLFNLGDKKGHIYSDVEGSEMTNYLLFDGECIAQEKQKNLKSNHRPGGMKS